MISIGVGGHTGPPSSCNRISLSTLSELWTSALHFGLFGLICALSTPMVRVRSVAGQRLVLTVDVMLGLLALACACYLILFEDALYQRGVTFSLGDWLVSITAVLLILPFKALVTGMLLRMMGARRSTAMRTPAGLKLTCMHV